MKKNLLYLIKFIFFILLFELIIFFLEPIIGEYIKIIISILILSTVLYGIIKSDKEKLNYSTVTTLILIIGVLLRTLYIVNTNIDVRQHDVETLEYDGHLSYIYTLYETNKLPSTNDGQFYHPPLFHFTAAIFLKTIMTFNISLERGFESIQILTLLFSSLTLFIISLVLSRIKISDNKKHIINIFLAVNPSLIILSGSINNDCLEVLLQTAILLYLLKYYEKSNIKNTIILGILTGLCIFTKLNGIIMLGPIFIMILYKYIKDKDIKLHISNFLFIIFLTIIIGIPYQIRSFILFKTLSVPDPSDWLYIGNYSFIERFIIPSITSIYTKFCTLPGDYNLFAYIVKCSIFGEFKYNIPNYLYYLFVSTNLILILVSTVLIVINIKNIFKNKINMLFITNYFINILSFIYFNIKHPFICTMDYRYIIPTLFTGIIALELSDNKIFNYIINTIIFIFIILSVVFLFYI